MILVATTERLGGTNVLCLSAHHANGARAKPLSGVSGMLSAIQSAEWQPNDQPHLLQRKPKVVQMQKRIRVALIALALAISSYAGWNGAGMLPSAVSQEKLSFCAVSRIYDADGSCKRFSGCCQQFRSSCYGLLQLSSPRANAKGGC